MRCKNHQADDKLSVSAENCATRFLDLRYRPDSTEKNDLCVKILFAKYVMTIKTQTLLTKLFGQCKSLGIVKSQYEFSRLCGRRQSWYSASKCRNVQISTEAAVTLSVMIEKRAREELPEDIRPYALNLSRLLLETIKEQAEVKQC
ncbi:MAG: hypothetical protein EB015_20050 [Methylocystaceae bacterium]|nr:hypothetical protein [Methylocystaceae bacterium]